MQAETRLAFRRLPNIIPLRTRSGRVDIVYNLYTATQLSQYISLLASWERRLSYHLGDTRAKFVFVYNRQGYLLGCWWCGCCCLLTTHLPLLFSTSGARQGPQCEEPGWQKCRPSRAQSRLRGHCPSAETQGWGHRSVRDSYLLASTSVVRDVGKKRTGH